MSKLIADMNGIKESLFPDFTWFELLDLLLWICWYGIIGVLNHFRTFDLKYPSFNFFQGKFSSGLIQLSDLHLLKLGHIEDFILDLELQISLRKLMITIQVNLCQVNLLLPDSCLDYWQNGQHSSA